VSASSRSFCLHMVRGLVVSWSALRYGLGISAINYQLSAISYQLLGGPPHTGRHRTADSTAPTSKIPNVYGPQDDRTAKTPPRPQPVAPVKRSSLLRCPARLKARFPVRFRRRQAHCGSASWARSARLHASTTPRRVKGLSFAKEDLPSPFSRPRESRIASAS